MSSIPSTAVSSIKNSSDCSIINHRILALDPDQYRRQIEHFEYYWGLKKGDIDLASPLNHIQIRADMSERLKNCEWIFMPTPETLRHIRCMAEHNKTADPQSRRNCLKELPDEEYEYDFVPLLLLDRSRRRPSLYIEHGTGLKAIRAPYKAMPRIKSRAHPIFVVFLASQQLDKAAPFVMSDDKAGALMSSVGDIVTCWLQEPPADFLIGPDIWHEHRHPLSDAGMEIHDAHFSPRKGKAAQRDTERKMTRAPCKQTKTAKRTKPYSRLDTRPPRGRPSALPYPGIELGDDSVKGLTYPLSELRAWIDDVAAQHDNNAWRHTSSLDEEARDDEVLVRYRQERARKADSALAPLTNVKVGSGLIIGNGLDLSGYSSNNWAMRAHGICLLGKNPFGRAT